MRISILTPAWNAAGTLPGCLASVRAQSHPDLEHIVIDGASTDGTLDLLKAQTGGCPGGGGLPRRSAEDAKAGTPPLDNVIPSNPEPGTGNQEQSRLFRYVSEPDHGLYDALNKGVALATGDVVGQLNADDAYARPGVLETVARTFEETGADAVYGDLVYIAETNKARSHGEHRDDHGGEQHEDLLRASSVSSVSPCFVPTVSTPDAPPSTLHAPCDSDDSRGSTLHAPPSTLHAPCDSDASRGCTLHPPPSTLHDTSSSINPPPGYRVVRYWRSGPYQPDLFYRGWMPPHPTFFVRRECYARLGGYRLDLATSADYELMLRFLLAGGLRAAWIPEVLVRMRTGGLSNVTWKARWRANRMDRRAWEVNGLRPWPWTLLLKPLRKLPQWWRRPV